MILHLCNDLMLTAKLSSWAKANQFAYKNASSLSKLENVLTDSQMSSQCQAVVIDLQFPKLDIPNVVSQVRQALGNIPLTGYVQHVMTEIIEVAESHDFDQVMTRGQFDRQFPSLFETPN